MDTIEIPEAEIAKYRFPPCAEYIEFASTLQALTVHFSLIMFGPVFTRSMAEFFNFKKSRFPALTDDQIKSILLKRQQIPPKPLSIFTPVAKKLETQHNNDPYLQGLYRFLDIQEIEDPLDFIVFIKNYQERGAIAKILRLSHEQDHHFKHDLDKICQSFNATQGILCDLKSSIKDLCLKYSCSPRPYKTLEISDHSAFQPFKR